MNINRRNFIQVAACGATLPWVAQSFPPGAKGEVFKGFIVSDSHFGWTKEDQPAPDDQIAAMNNIMERFPDLDLMIDTGDAHHGGLRGEKGAAARALWTDIIAGITGSIPFMYVPGNHEIMGWREGDPEWRCNRLGSLCCRPYYSFDYKGVHFVSVPELMMAVYVNKETIEWLKLDLALNRDKTVVLLSHNNISGTTGPDEEGYRGLVNSSELKEIIRANPNIIAWMHGHNHNFQMMKMESRLFVSNGRIGGFDPSKGRHGIGGIYFEISASGMTVQSYSAELNRMLTDADGPEVETSVVRPTTYRVSGGFNYSYGSGGARNLERIPVVNHYAGQANKDHLFIAGAADKMISEDPEMTRYQCRTSNNHMQLFGFIVRDPKKLWRWDNPGITLLERDDGQDIRVTLPHYGAGRTSYYRCPPGQKYKVTIDLEAADQGPTLELQFLWHDRNGQFITQWNLPKVMLEKGRKIEVFETFAPNPEIDSIYDNSSADQTLNFISQAIFREMSADVKIHSFKLEMAETTSGQTQNAVVKIDGTPFATSGKLFPEAPVSFDVPPFRDGRQGVELGAEGNKRLSWLIRRENLDWQVRNAPVADHEQYLEIGTLRNGWTDDVCIASLFHCSEMFVSRLSGINGAKIYPLNRGNDRLKVEVLDTFRGDAVVEVTSKKRPKRVDGAPEWTFENGIIRIPACSGAIIEISD